jgi:hypothetical protein
MALFDDLELRFKLARAVLPETASVMVFGGQVIVSLEPDKINSSVAFQPWINLEQNLLVEKWLIKQGGFLRLTSDSLEYVPPEGSIAVYRNGHALGESLLLAKYAMGLALIRDKLTAMEKTPCPS